MNKDVLAGLALVIAAAPFFTPSPRAFSIAVLVGLLGVPLLSYGILSVPSKGYGDTFAGGIAVAFIGAVFLAACVIRALIMMITSSRLPKSDEQLVSNSKPRRSKHRTSRNNRK